MSKEQKVKLIIDVDNQNANQEIQETGDEIKKVKTNMEDVGETGDAISGGLVTRFKNITNAVQGAIKGLRTLKGVLIATGIGAFAIAVVAVGKAFTNSEEGQNRFAKLMGQIAVVTGNVFDILEDLGKSIINVSKLFANFFTGNLVGAKEAFDDLKVSIGDTVEGVKNFGEETRKEIAQAGKLADERARANKLERDLLVERAQADQKRAELLEKAVDRENFSTQERIAFLQEASALDEEITNKEIQLAQIRLDNKKLENSFSESTKEDLEEEAQLQAELIGLETARLSKQKEVTSQIIGLKNEEKAANEAASKAAQDEINAQQAALDNFLLAEREAIAVNEEEKKQLQITKVQERYDALIEQAKKFGRDTAALESARTRTIAAITESGKKTEETIVEDTEKNKYDTALKFTALGIGLAAEGSNAAKALGIANAIISTYAGAAQVLDDTTLPLFAKIAGVATVIATGFQQIRAIKQTQIPVLNVGGVTAGGQSSSPAPSLTPPSFNVVGASASNALAETIAGQQGEPVRAYVVANDVTTAQSVDRNIVQSAGI